MRVVSSFLDLAQDRNFLGTVIDVIRNLKCLRYFHNKPLFCFHLLQNMKACEVGGR